jgi:transcriptional regulator with XRE-family HTH domain
MRDATNDSPRARQRNPRRTSAAPKTLQLAMGVLGVSDAQLGDRLGVSRQTIHSWRTGRTSMTLDTAAQIADALGIEAALFGGRPSDAVRWLADHRADDLDQPAEGEPGRGRPRSRCTLLTSADRSPRVLSHVGTLALAG